MLVTVVMNGFSSSFRKVKTRHIIQNELKSFKTKLLSARGNLFHIGRRKIKKFITDNQNENDYLLLVGKSLGGKRIIQYLNQLQNLNYKKIFLLTLDPCWPKWLDWTPNLNEEKLCLIYPIHKGINLKVVLPPSEQCGSSVVGMNMRNIEVLNADHYNIVSNPIVRDSLRNLLQNCKLELNS